MKCSAFLLVSLTASLACGEEAKLVVNEILTQESHSQSDSRVDRMLFDDNILYNISFLASHLPSNKTDVEDHQHAQEEVILVNSNQDRYRCLVPIIAAEEEHQVIKKNQEHVNPYKLLRPLFEHTVCSFRVENYWTYEICHGKYIKQYHEEPEGRGNSQQYLLGKFNMDHYASLESYYEQHRRGKALLKVNVDDLILPYIELNMTDGTECDLANTKRFTRVLYVCIQNGKHELYSVKETATCEYEVIAFSPLLCQLPQFKLKNSEENGISCYPLDGAPAIPTGYELKDLKQTTRVKQDSFKQLVDDAFWKLGSKLLEEPSDASQLKVSQSEEEMDRIDRIDSYSSTLLVDRFLSGDHCLTGETGWWKYEFCYKKGVLQYHEEKNAARVEIKLGQWNLEEHVRWLEQHPSKRVKPGKTPKQVSHFYSNGDTCEETNKPRSVEVKLRCANTKTSAEYVALYLLEPSTCEYVLGIESPIICDLLSTVDENGLFERVFTMQLFDI